jgi:hypothetical protein
MRRTVRMTMVRFVLRFACIERALSGKSRHTHGGTFLSAGWILNCLIPEQPRACLVAMIPTHRGGGERNRPTFLVSVI